jgi:hypothetical protein
MATEAAWLKRKNPQGRRRKGRKRTGKNKQDLTLTGLLMEGVTSFRL